MVSDIYKSIKSNQGKPWNINLEASDGLRFMPENSKGKVSLEERTWKRMNIGLCINGSLCYIPEIDTEW